VPKADLPFTTPNSTCPRTTWRVNLSRSSSLYAPVLHPYSDTRGTNIIEGFRMTVGNPAADSKQGVGLTYQCLSGNNRGREMSDFPTSPCSGGIFTTHHFPAYVAPPYLLPHKAAHTDSPWSGAGTARTSTALTTSPTCSGPRSRMAS
jgi:hypothetical protein